MQSIHVPVLGAKLLKVGSGSTYKTVSFRVLSGYIQDVFDTS